MASEYFRLTDVPNETLALISEALLAYTVALLGVKFDMPGVDTVELLGSATLVKLGDCAGLITVRHVATRVETASWLGLTLKQSEDDYKIPREHLEIAFAESSSAQGSPPDLAFILLQDRHAADIASERRFCDLPSQRQEYLENLPPHEHGPWVACGAIGERTTLEDALGDFAAVASIQLYSGFSGFAGEDYEGEFDFYEIEARSSSTDAPPRTFKGMSGGGLWQVPIRSEVDGGYTPNRYLLAGVIASETRISKDVLRIRSYGRKSLYEHLWRIIERKCA